jgi:diguanylate cyclase (GGDEF)-like protein
MIPIEPLLGYIVLVQKITRVHMPHSDAIIKIDEMIANNNDIGIMLIDICDFSRVNVGLGFSAGDSVLRITQNTIAKWLMTGGCVFRYHSDKFIVTLPSITSKAKLAFYSNLLVNLFNRHPVKLNSLVVPIDVKVVYITTLDTSPYAAKILQSLEFALRQLKLDNNDSVRSAETSNAELERLFRKVSRFGIIKDAMDSGELVNFYQPICNSQNGAIVGCESLVRWRNPQIGLMPPSSFLPYIERHRQLVQLTLTVVKNVAFDFKDCWERLPEGFYISINIPPDVLLDSGALSRVLKAFSKHGMPLNYLAAEITEEALAGSIGNVVEVCKELTQLGVRIMIDDFGTGYSSIDRISRLPIYAIKVDKSYMLNQNDIDVSAAVVKFAVDIAATKKAIVICEGVADQDISIKARALGVKYVQGFYYSRPVPAIEFIEQVLPSPKADAAIEMQIAK